VLKVAYSSTASAAMTRQKLSVLVPVASSTAFAKSCVRFDRFQVLRIQLRLPRVVHNGLG
jgi:hypothetical protein